MKNPFAIFWLSILAAVVLTEAVLWFPVFVSFGGAVGLSGHDKQAMFVYTIDFGTGAAAVGAVLGLILIWFTNKIGGAK